MGRPRIPLWNLDADFESDLTARSELQFVLDLIGLFTLWVEPEVAKAVPVVYPRTARLQPRVGRQGEVRNGIRYWTNQPAESAVLEALGSNEAHFTGIVVCHVYPGSPYRPRHFTRLANLFVIPRSLSALTEWKPVLAALAWRAFKLYGYCGPSGTRPTRPAIVPSHWATPIPLGAPALRKVIGRLRHLRATRPMFSTPRKAPVPPGRARRLTSDALDLEAEFWQASLQRGWTPRFLAWVVRHAAFAPVSVVNAVPNPFPKTRRARPWRGERPTQVKGRIALTDNAPALVALVVSLGAARKKTRGAVADHLWPGSAYLPAHNAHLAGLALLPSALATLADAPPIRACLQRHAFQRTGYAGPSGTEPPRPGTMPDSWPEIVHLTPEQEAKAIAKLRRYLAERPQYYRRRRPQAGTH